MKCFNVKLNVCVSIPYEEGFLNGKISRTHLMYLAQSKFPSTLSTVNMKYETDYVDITDHRNPIIIPITHRLGVTLEQTEENKSRILELNV